MTHKPMILQTIAFALTIIAGTTATMGEFNFAAFLWNVVAALLWTEIALRP